MSQTIDPPAHPGDTLGVLLIRLRQAQGKSQVRLAGMLCAASGQPTLTRHEISRWEREERIPSQIWLCWLALVLDTSLDDLERAAAHTRRRREPTMTLTTATTLRSVPPLTTGRTRPGGRAPDGPAPDGPAPDGPAPGGAATSGAATSGAAATDAATDATDGATHDAGTHGAATGTAAPGGAVFGGVAPGTAASRRGGAGGAGTGGAMRDAGTNGTATSRAGTGLTATRTTATGRSGAGRSGAGRSGAGRSGAGGAVADGDGTGRRVVELRRMDDLVAGPELVALVLAELRSAVGAAGAGREASARVAELVQLHAWVAADAGRPALDSTLRGGVRAALTAGDRALAGHLLGCVAQAAAERGDARAAGRAALAAERVAGPCDPATATLLSLRVAFAAAGAGDQRACDDALASAERSHGRRSPTPGPPWLYWLDDAHVDALTGLCLTAAGRHAAALPRLVGASRAPGVRFRAAGLVGAAKARAHLAAGDLDAACAAAAETLVACVDSGSFRVLRQLRRLEAALDTAAGSGRRPAPLLAYAQLAESAAGCLPGAAPAPRCPAGTRRGPSAAVGGPALIPGRAAS